MTKLSNFPIGRFPISRFVAETKKPNQRPNNFDRVIGVWNFVEIFHGTFLEARTRCEYLTSLEKKAPGVVNHLIWDCR